MGKRQVRLEFNKDQNKISELIGKQVTVILNNGAPIFGTLNLVGKTQITQKNGRGRKMINNIKNIVELIYDI